MTQFRHLFLHQKRSFHITINFFLILSTYHLGRKKRFKCSPIWNNIFWLSITMITNETSFTYFMPGWLMETNLGSCTKHNDWLDVNSPFHWENRKRIVWKGSNTWPKWPFWRCNWLSNFPNVFPVLIHFWERIKLRSSKYVKQLLHLFIYYDDEVKHESVPITFICLSLLNICCYWIY